MEGITARVGNNRVRILNVKLMFAYVEKLSGEPYWSWTHGGWASYSTTTVPVALVHDVEHNGEYLGEPCTCTPDLPDGRTGNVCAVCVAANGDDIPCPGKVQTGAYGGE